MQKFFSFVRERHEIYKRRAAGHPAPWTKDLILQKYRFTNVYRELDKTTIWIAKNWRFPNQHEENLWFALCVARRVNLPESLAELDCPVLKWNPKKFVKTLVARRERDERMFGGAYMITTGGSEKEWAAWQAEEVLTPLWEARKDFARIEPVEGLVRLFEKLCSFHGFGGGFIAAQVIADLKYVPKWYKAFDWETFAAPGPGSKRGLNRVWGKPPDTPWPGNSWQEKLLELKSISDSHPALDGMMQLHAQDLQSACCEFDRYERAEQGQKGLRVYASLPSL